MKVIQKKTLAPLGYHKNYNDFFRQLLFLALLLGLGAVIFMQLNFFIGAFLGATTLYIVLRRTMFKLSERYGWKRGLAALFLVTLTAIFLSGLFYGVFEVALLELPDIDVEKMSHGANELITKINGWVGYKVIPEKFLQDPSSAGGLLKGLFSSLFNATYSAAANMFMMIVLLYFMLAFGRKMEAKIFAYQPFRGRSLALLKSEFWNMIYSNAVGIPLSMLAQGITSVLVYWLVGLDNIVFWAFLTAVFGLIPMVGTSIVTIPLGIFAIAAGNMWQGIIIILCGLLVIANADNLCRIVFMKKVANTPPLIIIFGVILGIPLFGFWGIIFGPLLLSVFIMLIRIYYVEYSLLAPEKS